jgi:hypothetical protein
MTHHSRPHWPVTREEAPFPAEDSCSPSAPRRAAAPRRRAARRPTRVPTNGNPVAPTSATSRPFLMSGFTSILASSRRNAQERACGVCVRCGAGWEEMKARAQSACVCAGGRKRARASWRVDTFIQNSAKIQSERYPALDSSARPAQQPSSPAAQQPTAQQASCRTCAPAGGRAPPAAPRPASAPRPFHTDSATSSPASRMTPPGPPLGLDSHQKKHQQQKQLPATAPGARKSRVRVGSFLTQQPAAADSQEAQAPSSRQRLDRAAGCLGGGLHIVAVGLGSLLLGELDACEGSAGSAGEAELAGAPNGAQGTWACAPSHLAAAGAALGGPGSGRLPLLPACRRTGDTGALQQPRQLLQTIQVAPPGPATGAAAARAPGAQAAHRRGSP